MMKAKIIIILLSILLTINGYSQFRKFEKQNHNVNKTLKSIINDVDFKNASLGFLAIDSETGKIISSHHPDLALKPASTQKLFSTATVLELYSPDYQFETILEYSGRIDTTQHILYGNIYIKGGGDPTLGSRYFECTKNKQFLEKWVQVIKKLKIDSIAGAVIADAGIYDNELFPASWQWDDIGNYYGAGACGLSIYDNNYSIYFNSGNSVGDTVVISKVIPDILNLQFENQITSDSINYDNAYIFGAPYSSNRMLKGEIPLNQTDFEVKGALPDPAYTAALEFENTLKKANIKIKEKATTIRLLKLKKAYKPEKRTKFFIINSPNLSEMIAQTNIHSINSFAEHCLKHSGLKLIGNASTWASVNSLEKYWQKKGMDIQGLSLNDGSGVSHYNLITPRQMVFLLDYMKKKSDYFKDYYNSLAIAGKLGTIKNMFKGSAAEGNLRAKSGTISRVKAYAGYVKSASGREIIFSMAVNNFSCSSRVARAKLEKLMIALAEFNK